MSGKKEEKKPETYKVIVNQYGFMCSCGQYMVENEFTMICPNHRCTRYNIELCLPQLEVKRFTE